MDEISLRNILKIECHRYFDSSWKDYNKINKKIRNKTIVNMLSAYFHKGKEVLLLMDNGNFKHKINVGDYEAVAISEEMETLMYNSNCTFTAFHNHPEESTFSLDDLEKLLYYEKIQLLVLCTNSCRYCAALYKPQNLSKRELRALSILIDKYKTKYNVDGHCSAIYFIKRLQEKEKIFYYEAMNRRVKK